MQEQVNQEVPGSNPPPYCYLDLFSVVPSSTPRSIMQKATWSASHQLEFLIGNALFAIFVSLFTVFPISGLLVQCRSREKSQISRDFQGQIRGKNGQFRGNFAGIFEASFAEKRLVNGRFRESFPSKFCWKVIGFALI